MESGEAVRRGGAERVSFSTRCFYVCIYFFDCHLSLKKCNLEHRSVLRVMARRTARAQDDRKLVQR